MKSASFTSNVSTTSQKAHESLSGLQKDSIQSATPKIDSSSTSQVPSSAITTETVSCHVTNSADTEQTETIARSIAADTSGKNQEESKSVIKSLRLTGNRNVVIAETTNISNRKKIAQETSNRIVVSSSNTNNSSEKINNDTDSDIDLDELIKQEDEIKKSKT